MQNLWLASGGTYLILGVSLLVGFIAFTVLSFKLGNARGQHADGCSLAIGNFVCMIVGGGIGLLIAPFPWFVLSSLGLGLLFPMVLTGFWVTRR